MSHPARLYHTLEQLLGDMVGDMVGEDTEQAWRIRHWTRIWKQHRARHGNVPLIIRCPICSGRAHVLDIKHGCWKLARPSKAERDEQKGVGDDEHS